MYWYGGTGNWSDYTNHWSNNSGNSPASPASNAPTATDDVVFDTLSNATAYTVTIDAAATCRDFTMGAPLAGAVTWAGSSALTVSGSIDLVGGTAGITRTYTGVLTFNATSLVTIATNGVALASSTVFNGTGGTFRLVDDYETAASFTMTAGTFDATTNSKKVTLTGGAVVIVPTVSLTFYDLTRTGSASLTASLEMRGNITITHTLALNGNSAIYRLLVYSSTIGTPRTITITGTTGNSYSNVDFKDIYLYDEAGDVDLSAITGFSGDCGGNDGIIFTDSDTMTWKDALGGNWSDVLNWTKTAAAADRVPLPQDDVDMGVAFDVSQTVTQNMPRAGRSIDWTGATGTPTWTTSTVTSIFGSLTLVAGMVLTASTQAYTFEGRDVGMPVGGWTITSAGLIFGKVVVINSIGGTYKLSDNFANTGSTFSLAITNGNFTANDQNITCGVFSLSGVGTVATRIVNMGAGTLELTGTGNVFVGSSTYLTLTASSLNVKISNTSNTSLTFYSGTGTGAIFNNIWFSRGASTASNTISGSNTFNDFKDDGTAAHSILFTAATTQTFTTFTVNGTAGNLITIGSVTAAQHYLVNTGGQVSCDYLSVSRSTITPATCLAGANSTDGGLNNGWKFAAELDKGFQAIL